MFAYNVFLNNVRKYDVGRNAKSIIKRLYMFRRSLKERILRREKKS